MIEIASKIAGALTKNDFVEAIQLTRNWLTTCQPGQIQQLVETCSPAQRERVKLILRDLLSRYPNIVLGCPLLVYAAPSVENPTAPNGIRLPYPPVEHLWATADLRFLGWVPSYVQLPISWPILSGEFDTTVSWSVPTVFVAVFRVRLEAVTSGDDIAGVPSLWWAELFSSTINAPDVGSVRIDGQLLLTFPDATEVAAAMQAGARGEPPSSRNVFQHDINWAAEAGLAFHEECLVHVNKSMDL